jgi:hypothetical protein
MATGKIVSIKEGPKGVYGFVADDAIEGINPERTVYFDSRCFATSAAIGRGDRVEFEYDLSNRGSKPRMRFDSLTLIGEPDHNGGEN